MPLGCRHAFRWPRRFADADADADIFSSRQIRLMPLAATATDFAAIFRHFLLTLFAPFFATAFFFFSLIFAIAASFLLLRYFDTPVMRLFHTTANNNTVQNHTLRCRLLLMRHALTLTLLIFAR